MKIKKEQSQFDRIIIHGLMLCAILVISINILVNFF